MNALITARKRSLGQGNMFTGVCLSTGGGGPGSRGGVWSWGGAWSWGGVPGTRGSLVPGGGLVLGGACSRGHLLQGVWSRGVPGGLLLLRAVRILLECILV